MATNFPIRGSLLKSNSWILSLLNKNRDLVASARLTFGGTVFLTLAPENERVVTLYETSTGANSFSIPWKRLLDAGDWVVVLVALVLWASCVFAVLCLGVRAMSGREGRRTKKTRGR